MRARVTPVRAGTAGDAASGAAAAPAASAASAAPSPGSGDWLAIAMPSDVATVPSMPARPRFAYTGMRRPGTARSASRMSREAPNTSRSCGQVAAQTASTSMRRVTGARTAASWARVYSRCAAKSDTCPVSSTPLRTDAATGSSSSTIMRLARTQRPVHARSSADGSCAAARTARSKRRTRRPGLYHSMPVDATTIVSTPSRCTSAGTSRERVGCPKTITRSTASPNPGSRSSSR